MLPAPEGQRLPPTPGPVRHRLPPPPLKQQRPPLNKQRLSEWLPKAILASGNNRKLIDTMDMAAALRPHAVFLLDKQTKEESLLELNADGAAMLNERRNPNLSLASDLAMLGRFGKALTIEGRVFGVAFVLTPQQLKAIADFAARR